MAHLYVVYLSILEKLKNTIAEWIPLFDLIFVFYLRSDVRFKSAHCNKTECA